MKKLLALLLTIFLTLTFSGCLDETLYEEPNTSLTSSKANSEKIEITPNVDSIVGNSSEIFIQDDKETTNNSNESPSKNNSNDTSATSEKPVSSETITSHIHKYSNATCTAPKTCSCGTTTGKANGHNWKAPTCTAPKTCTICGTKTGLTAGHNFADGSCVTCGKSDPAYTNNYMVWIPTNGGTKYHTHSGCSNMENPEQVTKSEAESLGFTPCKRCD